MKPFNLEEAKAGMPVHTTSGKKVRIICFDRKSIYPIVALIEETNYFVDVLQETIGYYDEEGCADRSSLIPRENLVMYDGSTHFVARFYKEGEGIIEASELCETKSEAEMKYRNLPFFVDIIEVDR